MVKSLNPKMKENTNFWLGSMNNVYEFLVQTHQKLILLVVVIDKF